MHTLHVVIYCKSRNECEAKSQVNLTSPGKTLTFCFRAIGSKNVKLFSMQTMIFVWLIFACLPTKSQALKPQKTVSICLHFGPHKQLCAQFLFRNRCGFQLLLKTIIFIAHKQQKLFLFIITAFFKH